MPSAFALHLGGEPMPDALNARLGSIEAEESAEMDGALRVRFAISRDEAGELAPLGEPGLAPGAPVALVVRAGEREPQCVFDGFAQAQRIHLEPGLAGAHVDLLARDASWLLDRDEHARAWPGATDGAIANALFDEHGCVPDPRNLDHDSPRHEEATGLLMQRSTDWQLLRSLARRSGKLLMIRGGGAPDERTGVFALPDLTAAPVATLAPNRRDAANIGAIDIEWDIARPTSVAARQILFTDTDPAGASVEAGDSGLAALDERGLAALSATPGTAMLTTPAGTADALTLRAEGALREAGWFVRVTGSADASTLGHVLRVGEVVELEGVGSIHSGKYLVWSVRHEIDAAAHLMRFTLVRNALGPAPASGGGLLAGLL